MAYVCLCVADFHVYIAMAKFIECLKWGFHIIPYYYNYPAPKIFMVIKNWKMQFFPKVVYCEYEKC